MRLSLSRGQWTWPPSRSSVTTCRGMGHAHMKLMNFGRENGLIPNSTMRSDMCEQLKVPSTMNKYSASHVHFRQCPVARQSPLVSLSPHFLHSFLLSLLPHRWKCIQFGTVSRDESACLKRKARRGEKGFRAELFLNKNNPNHNCSITKRDAFKHICTEWIPSDTSKGGKRRQDGSKTSWLQLLPQGNNSPWNDGSLTPRLESKWHLQLQLFLATNCFVVESGGK